MRKDISSLVRLLAFGLIFVVATLWSVAQAAADQAPQPADAEVAQAADRFERLVFPAGEDRVGELVEKSPVTYGLLEKRGNSAAVDGLVNVGFDRLMFDRHFLWLTSSEKRLSPGMNLPRVDVLAVAADGPPPSDRASLLQAMAITAPVEWRDTALFAGACTLARLYVGARLEKTVAFFDLRRVGQWPPGDGSREVSILPGACLAAGIAAHLGLRNIAALAPEEIIETGRAGEHFVRPQLVAAIGQLYRSAIVQGMSRSEARQHLLAYLEVATQEYHARLDAMRAGSLPPVAPPANAPLSAVTGVRCVVILESGASIIVRLPTYARQACMTAGQSCAKGRPVRRVEYFEQMTAMMMPSTLSGYVQEVCERK